jgi:hypothetical protein
MWANIEHLLFANSQIEIDVITSKEASIPTSVRARVNYFEYSANWQIEKLIDGLEIDEAYRQGFWRYSLERIFALTQHHKRFPNEGLLHVESDVLVLETFPFEVFSKIKKRAWSKLDDERDVAAILYSPKLDASTWLEYQIIDLLCSASNLNDMRILSLISNEFPDDVCILPTVPKNAKEILLTGSTSSNINKLRASENSKIFGGIFDAAPIGIWLTGSHGVNSFGVSKRYDNNLVINSNSMINPSQMNLQYKPGYGLFAISGELQIPIHTLHIHSKDIRFFSSSAQKLISKCVSESKKNRVIKQFSAQILLELFIDNYRKKSLIRFLSWLPPFNKYRILRDYLRRR